MPRRKRVKWELGAGFGIPLGDGSFAIGQAIAFMMPNVINVAISRQRVFSLDQPMALAREEIIAAISITRELLDFGVWPVVGILPNVLGARDFPNERFRSKRWIGAKIQDAGVVEHLVRAYHLLQPWDTWHDPNYLDDLLLSPKFRPRDAILTKSDI